MATKKSNSSKSTTKRSGGPSLNKISMYTIIAVAILYCVGLILSLCGTGFKIVYVLKDLAVAIMVCIVSILAWKYCRNKQTVWKVLYFICLLIVIVGIIIPLIK